MAGSIPAGRTGADCAGVWGLVLPHVGQALLVTKAETSVLKQMGLSKFKADL